MPNCCFNFAICFMECQTINNLKNALCTEDSEQNAKTRHNACIIMKTVHPKLHTLSIIAIQILVTISSLCNTLYSCSDTYSYIHLNEDAARYSGPSGCTVFLALPNIATWESEHIWNCWILTHDKILYSAHKSYSLDALSWHLPIIHKVHVLYLIFVP